MCKLKSVGRLAILKTFRRYAAELIALQSAVIVAIGTPAIVPLRQATRTIPIVFVAVVDPVGSGLVSSLARPGGNLTGFTLFEYSIGAKWLELLKEIAPQVTRVAIMRDSTSAAGVGQFSAIQTVAATALELSVIDLHDASNVEQSVVAFAQGSPGGLIITPSPFGANHPDVIASLAAKYKLPAVYPFRYFVNASGLMSYGPVIRDQFRRAAKYVDRILKGERTTDLPVQAPTKYELVVNMKVQRLSVSTFRPRCSPVPTRSSNDPEAPALPTDDDETLRQFDGCCHGMLGSHCIQWSINVHAA